MLKEIFSKVYINNSKIEIANTDDIPTGKKFKARFITPGVAGYPGQFGNVLITKESLDKFVKTLETRPIIIKHQTVTNENIKQIEVGRINNVWFNEADGWYWCDGVLTDDKAIDLINQGWSVSCSYNVTLADDKGGFENNVKYDIEFLNGVFTHLALVDNPRYERAMVVMNDKTIYVDNYRSDQKRDEKGKWVKDDAVIQAKKDKLVPVKIDIDNLPISRKDISNWVISMFDKLKTVTIQDTGVTLDLSHESAERETIKRRVKKPQNKVVYSEFKEIVEKAIKIDERKQDERHNRNQEIYYNKFQFGGEDYEMQLFVDEPYISDISYRYAGHRANKIQNEMVSRDTWGVVRIPNTKDTINSIITDNKENFKSMDINNDKWITIHPHAEDSKADNAKEQFIEALKQACVEVLDNN